MSAENLDATLEENTVLRRGVVAFTMRETHIAEIWQGVRNCPSCRSYVGPHFTEDAQPCEKYLSYSKDIEAAQKILVNGMRPS